MKTILKLVIVAAILNAVARGALATWDYYQLRDSAERALLFGSSSTSAQIHAQVLEKAMELELPLNAESLSVRLRGNRRIVEGSYTQSIEFFPSYRYPVEFSFNVDNIVTTLPARDEDYPPAR